MTPKSIEEDRVRVQRRVCNDGQVLQTHWIMRRLDDMAKSDCPGSVHDYMKPLDDRRRIQAVY